MTCNCALPSMYPGCCQHCQNRLQDNVIRGPYNPYPGYPIYPGGAAPLPYVPLTPSQPLAPIKSVKVITEEDYNALLERIKKLEDKQAKA